MNNTRFYKDGYPRPQLVKDYFQILDGEWQFAFDDLDVGEKEKWYLNFPTGKKIIVPFSYHTKASGIGLLEEHVYTWYKKEVNYDYDLTKKKVLNIISMILIIIFIIQHSRIIKVFMVDLSI